MEELENFIRKFSKDLRRDINNFYEYFYEYLMDLYSYKGIKIKDGNIEDLPLKKDQDLPNLLLKITKIGLETIGVSNSSLQHLEAQYERTLKEGKVDEKSLKDLFDNGLKHQINLLLFSILVDFILNVNSEIIEKLEKYELLNTEFKQKLLQFKSKSKIHPDKIEIFKKNEKTIKIVDSVYKSFRKNRNSFSTKSIRVDKMDPQSNNHKEYIKDSKEDETMIEDLENAIRENLEALKKSIKSSISSSEELLKKVDKSEPTTFLNQFGHFKAIDEQKIQRFTINIDNVKESILQQQNFYDLENLFYYISIMRMLGINTPLKKENIINKFQKFVVKGLFNMQGDEKPALNNIFYGLAILSELNLLKDNDLIDLKEVKRILEQEIEYFHPNKLHLNYFTFFSLELLKQNGLYELENSNILTLLINLNLFDLEEFDLVLDFYEQLACIKLLDKDAKLNYFKALYIKHLKEKMEENGSISNSITKTARTLLILDLLKLNKKEIMMSSRLLKYLVNTTEFFQGNVEKDVLNWQKDPIAFKLELRMLFWGLLASAQYSYII
jgi:hypothetical protein